MTTPTPDQGSEEPAADYIEPPTRKLARETLRKVVVALNRPDDGSDAQEPWSIIEDAIKASPNKAVATTPTPDQRALERAREIVKRATFGYGGSMDDEPNHDAIDPGRIRELIAAALTAAASEARTAAIKECIGTLDGYKEDIIDNEDWPDQDAELLNTLDSAIHMLRALATPAQSEGKP